MIFNLLEDLYKDETNNVFVDLEVSTLENTLNHFLWFHNNKIDIQLTNSQDVFVNQDKKYYYIDFISFSHFERVIEKYKNDNEFSLTIKKLLNQKNFKLIILDVHETQNHSYIKEFFDCFTEDEIKNILFINNDSNLTNIDYTSKLNTLKTNFLVKNTTKGLMEIPFESIWNVNKREKMFLCLNKEGKPHRYFILCLLEKYGLLDSTNYSFLTRPSKFHRNFDTYYFDDFDFYMRKLNVILRTPQISDYETKEESFDDITGLFQNNYNFAGEVNYNDYKNSYINIVTESVYFHSGIHITEKTIKPFILGQLPIFVSSPNHVEVLRKDYNLDLFDDFINHDYDKEKDDTRRMEMIIQECTRLSKMENEIIDFYKNNKERFLDNRQKLYEISKKDELSFLEYIL